MNLRQMLTNIRTRLGDDLRAQRPSTNVLLLLLSTQVQAFLTEANLSGNPWAVARTTLNANSGVEEYPIGAASSFGKPIQVYTSYASNPSHVVRDIEFYDLGSIYHDWDAPRNWTGAMWGDSPHTAARMAFFRKEGQDQVYVKIGPIPRASAQYEVLYQIGEYGSTTSLDEIPVLPQHHALIEVRTAIAALPHAEWDDDAKANSERRRELAMALEDERKLLHYNFRTSIATTTASRRPSRRMAPYSIDGDY